MPLLGAFETAPAATNDAWQAHWIAGRRGRPAGRLWRLSSGLNGGVGRLSLCCGAPRRRSGVRRPGRRGAAGRRRGGGDHAGCSAWAGRRPLAHLGMAALCRLFWLFDCSVEQSEPAEEVAKQEVRAVWARGCFAGSTAREASQDSPHLSSPTHISPAAPASPARSCGRGPSLSSPPACCCSPTLAPDCAQAPR